MRTLELNKTTLWYVESMGEHEIKDENGHYTGEIDTVYTEPKQIRLHLYPASGEIKSEAFGSNANVDMITTTEEVLSETTLLFTEKPTGNYSTTYTYRINEISKSLNSNRYGLKGR